MASMTAARRAANPPGPPAGLVGGIDTHKDAHHVAVPDPVGRPIADRQFRADGSGYARIVAFLQQQGHIDWVGVEGTGSYGAGIARALAAAGLTAVEVARTDRQARRRRANRLFNFERGAGGLRGLVASAC